MLQYDFNQNWRFRKAGESDTVTVLLPHDAMLHEKRDPASSSGSAGGYFPGGIYEYEKEFDVPADWKDKQVVLELEGVYRNAEVFVNGASAAKIFYGYTDSFIELSAFLKNGGKNNVRVLVDNSAIPNSRWYSGSGIYRPVRLYVLDPVRIELDGVKIRTLSIDPSVIEVTVRHTPGADVRVNILDQGKVIASAYETDGDAIKIALPGAQLWNEETPYLYVCQVLLEKDGQLLDSRESRFGVRQITYSAQDGLRINGKETLLRGGCIHHDNGILGACAYDEAERRKVKILKENGFNAIRSAHNPCSKALLDACDELGVFVMDETWDMWYEHKTEYDYASDFMAHYKEDVCSIVAKDQNHPSVILYSIGNEVSEPASPEGAALTRELTALFHELDGDRPVTIGINLTIITNTAQGKGQFEGFADPNDESGEMAKMDSTMFNKMVSMVGPGMNDFAATDEADQATSPALDAVDIAGYNYASGRYPIEGEKHPNRVIVGSETFPQDIAKNWAMVKKYPYLIGDFMWTAVDYLGEAGIGAWSYTDDAMGFIKPYPWLIGGAGVIDILGHPGGEALHTGVIWGKLPMAIAVKPANHPGVEPIHSVWRGTNAIASWSWAGCEENPTEAEVYSKAETVALLLNGEEIGRQPVCDYQCIFQVEYHPGLLEAVGYDADGKEIERAQLRSADGKRTIRIRPEDEAYRGKLLYLDIDICGENGEIESNADEKLKVSVTGGTLLGFGSAIQRTEENYLDGSFTTYYGRTLAIVRAEAEKMTVTAVGETLEEVSIELTVKK